MHYGKKHQIFPDTISWYFVDISRNETLAKSYRNSPRPPFFFFYLLSSIYGFLGISIPKTSLLAKQNYKETAESIF
ncbi:hypothetical protein BN1224_Wien3_A_03210 [Chlamydia pneumoniae]|nr:hypothetical protein BN1224_Wien3_A_03210 [Chlamydia pneumoniae]